MSCNVIRGAASGCFVTAANVLLAVCLSVVDEEKISLHRPHATFVEEPNRTEKNY